MILMLSGTSDGRMIGQALAEAGYKLTMTAVSGYGGQMLPRHDNIETAVGHLSMEDMVSFIREKGVNLLLDATHPYAVEASQNAIEACKAARIPYLRYERPDLKTESKENIIYLPSYEDAAKWLMNKEGRIFLTIGSRRLEPFTRMLDLTRLVTRVLPTPEVIHICTDLGLRPNQIIAMQGPFSQAINEAMFEMYSVKYLVTKASSKIGGFEEKIIAASKADMTTLVIERPNIVYENIFNHVEDSIKAVESLLED
ncbi:precorrin-6A reductase [Fusibacter sp. JL216-2]|uniref:precorrin-6A reductase n=1 Tax=Fusibacter sp. JL216-2 TaxID=3071453 RepID=UPI003D327B8D